MALRDAVHSAVIRTTPIEAGGSASTARIVLSSHPGIVVRCAARQLRLLDACWKGPKDKGHPPREGCPLFRLQLTTTATIPSASCCSPASVAWLRSTEPVGAHATEVVCQLSTLLHSSQNDRLPGGNGGLAKLTPERNRTREVKMNDAPQTAGHGGRRSATVSSAVHAAGLLPELTLGGSSNGSVASTGPHVWRRSADLIEQ